jgi:hypothetical protein
MLMFRAPSFAEEAGTGSRLPEVRLDGFVEKRGREVEYRNEAVVEVVSAGCEVDNDGRRGRCALSIAGIILCQYAPRIS